MRIPRYGSSSGFAAMYASTVELLPGDVLHIVRGAVAAAVAMPSRHCGDGLLQMWRKARGCQYTVDLGDVGTGDRPLPPELAAIAQSFRSHRVGGSANSPPSLVRFRHAA